MPGVLAAAPDAAAPLAPAVLAAVADAGWTFSPGVIAAVAVVGVVYVRRWIASRREAGALAAPGWRLAAFLGGLALILVALVSPVDRLGEQLFVMHMVQHLLVLDLASILLILGLTRVILRPVTRRVQALERAAGPLATPAFALVAYVGGMAFWHIPAIYDAALEHPVVHALEHVSFGVVGGLYWWHLLSPIRSRHRLGGLGPVAYMFAGKVLVGLLGIVLTFSPDALYDFYEQRPRYWGMSAVTDQNVGGAVMALQQSLVMGVALVVLLWRQLNESERETRRAETYTPGRLGK
ncbi:MAG TPA: cytochrome c oxidase assembly protein [Solirubrobacteraceae bacterium]|nr:cytochrome c oxidase assembly protein [Solirubrobacteraceae bacterium]